MMNTISEENLDTFSISESELHLIIKIISVTSARGGFKAEELKIVGELYEKMCSFIKKPETDSDTKNVSE